jgi:hypothetical protein
MWKKIIPLFKNLVWTPEHFLWTEQIFYFTVCEHLFCTVWTIYFKCLNIFWTNIFKTMWIFVFFHYGFCFEPVNNLDSSNNYLYCIICELLFFALHEQFSMNGLNIFWTNKTMWTFFFLYSEYLFWNREHFLWTNNYLLYSTQISILHRMSNLFCTV